MSKTSTTKSEKAEAKAKGKAASARSEALSLDAVKASPKKASFWATYTLHRAAVRVESTEAVMAAGPAADESAEDFDARVARMKEAAHADFALSDKLHAMLTLPEPSNDRKEIA